MFGWNWGNHYLHWGLLHHFFHGKVKYQHCYSFMSPVCVAFVLACRDIAEDTNRARNVQHLRLQLDTEMAGHFYDWACHVINEVLGPIEQAEPIIAQVWLIVFVDGSMTVTYCFDEWWLLWKSRSIEQRLLLLPHLEYSSSCKFDIQFHPFECSFWWQLLQCAVQWRWRLRQCSLSESELNSIFDGFVPRAGE